MIRDKNSVIDNEGQRLFNTLVPSEWIKQDLKPQYGEDYRIHITHRLPGYRMHVAYADRETTGKIFIVQLKSQERCRYIHKGETLSFPIETKYLKEYIDKYRESVFLIAVDLNVSMGYWVFTQKYINELENDKWREQKSLTLRIPTKNKITLSSDFEKAVEDAQKYMTKLYPGTIQNAVDAEKMRIQKLEPRVEPEIIYKDGSQHTIMHAKEQYTVNMTLQNISKKAMEDFFKGHPLAYEAGAILIKDNELLKSIVEKGGTIQSRVKIPVFASLVALDSDGNEKYSCPEVEGVLEGGINELRLTAFSQDKVYGIEDMIIYSKELKTIKQSPIKFNLAVWVGLDVKYLPSLEALYRFFSYLSKLTIRIFNKKHKLIDARNIRELEGEFLSQLKLHTDIIFKLSSIAKKMKLDIQVPNAFTEEEYQEINFLYSLLEYGEVVTENLIKGQFNMNASFARNKRLLELDLSTPGPLNLNGARKIITIFGYEIEVTEIMDLTDMLMAVEEDKNDPNSLNVTSTPTENSVMTERLAGWKVKKIKGK